MYTLRSFLVLALAACSLAAPPEDIPAECVLPKEKHVEASKCCKMLGLKENIEGATKECLALVKDKPTKGTEKKDGPPPVLKPEGFDCMDDCIMTKSGLMNDKKMDPDKIMAQAKVVFTGDWAAVGPAFVKKCLDQIGTAEKGVCSTSGADSFQNCLFRETYLNCPAKSWTDSDVCKANKERLTKCPKAKPFCARVLQEMTQ